jgi:CubicO group peptidase (beta-lactamase class C family)
MTPFLLLTLGVFPRLTDPPRRPAPARPPSEISGDRLAVIDHVVSLGLSARGFPGAAVVVGYDGRIVWQKGYGTLDWSRGAPVNPRHTLFDVASITKATATATAIMVLYDRRRLRLDDRVSRWIPSWAQGEKARVTVRDLLTHRAGLPAGRPLAREASSPAEARRLVLETPLVRPPGTRAEYSDIGAIVLGFVVEAAAREPLDRFLVRNVYAPLGMRDTRFSPPTDQGWRIAPTLASGPRGLVHDGAAQALGGVAGHAGLFTTATDLSRFAQAMLDGGRLGSARIASDSAVARFTATAGGSQALGWKLCAGGAACGRYLGTAAFGHNGFTGTSMWIDPERRLFVIVLTNWVLPPPWGRVAPLAVLHDVRSDIADIAVSAIHPAGAEGVPAPLPPLRAERANGWRHETAAAAPSR